MSSVNCPLRRHVVTSKILNPERFIFPRPPVVAFRRGGGLRASLVRAAEGRAAAHAGACPYRRPRCRACGHISSKTDLLGQRIAWPSNTPLLVCPLVSFTASPAVAALPLGTFSF